VTGVWPSARAVRPTPVEDVVDGTLVSMGVLGAVLTVTAVAGPLRAFLVLVVVVLLPGRAAVRLLPALGSWARWGLALTLGPALVTLGATAMAFTGVWHPLVLGACLCGAASLLIVHDLRRSGLPADDTRTHARTS